jgi:hypothetical protein
VYNYYVIDCARGARLSGALWYFDKIGEYYG